MKTSSLLQSTRLFSLATLISRIFGLIRDAVLYACLPLAWQDIFWAGIKIPSTFRQLFAEGALSAAFIPLLSKVREREGEEQAREVSHAVFTWLAVNVSAVVVICVLLGPWLIPFLLDFPDEKAWMEEYSVYVTQMMFPFLLFVAFSAWAMGVLNTYRRFFIPALAPVFYNLVLIAGALMLTPYFESFTLMIWMSAVVVLGGAMQYAVQIPSLIRAGHFPPRWIRINHPAVKELLRKMAPAVFGLAVFQINALVTQTYFASRYGEGGISSLTYAFRLIQFPLGIIGVALANASFPQISQQFARQDLKAACHTFTQVSKYMMLLMIPASVGLMVLGNDIVGLIYNRNDAAQDVLMPMIVMSLAGYSLGLLGYALVKILVQSFQAQHDFRTPVITGACAVAVNLILCGYCSSLPEVYPLWTLAVNSALASFINVLLLVILLKKKVVQIQYTPLGMYLLKVLSASAVMGGGCFFFSHYFPLEAQSFFTYLIRVILGMGIGISLYGLMGWFLFRDDLKAMLRVG